MLEAILNRKFPANISPISILAFLENVLNLLWELVFQTEYITTTTTTSTTTTTESTTQTTSKPTVTTVTTSTTSTTVLTTTPITVTSTTTASSSTTTTTTQSTSTTSPLPRLQNATGRQAIIRRGSYLRIICLPQIVESREVVRQKSSEAKMRMKMSIRGIAPSSIKMTRCDNCNQLTNFQECFYFSFSGVRPSL